MSDNKSNQNISKKDLPAPTRKHRYYTPDEVKLHNSANDCYVSIFYEVYDLTKFIQENYSSLMDPLIKAAGTDISHWFDPKTKDPKTCVLPGTSLQSYFCPNGLYPNIPPPFPDAEWNYNFDIPWWKNSNYKVGKLTKKVRKINIMNTLTEHMDLIECCQEETINEILERYKKYNDHAESYTWKRLQKKLDMDLTLDENDVPDERDDHFVIYDDDTKNIESEEYIPVIHLYFNDDLTEA